MGPGGALPAANQTQRTGVAAQPGAAPTPGATPTAAPGGASAAPGATPGTTPQAAGLSTMAQNLQRPPGPTGAGAPAGAPAPGGAPGAPAPGTPGMDQAEIARQAAMRPATLGGMP